MLKLQPLFFILTLLIIVIDNPVFAEKNHTDSDEENTITITSQFRDSSFLDTSSSVSVLSEELIKAAGEQHLEELLSMIANLNWAGGTSRARYFQIRGIGERSQYEGAPNPSVCVIIDDIDFSGIGMAATLFDTEQIEILRGPQSARYGANAIAGLINIKSKDPTLDNRLSAQLLTAEDDNWSTAVSVSGPLNKDKTLSGLFSTQKFSGNGFRHNSHFDSDNTNKRDEFTSRGKIFWQIDDSWHLATTLMLVNLDNGYDAWAIDNSLTTLSDKPGKDAQRTFAGSARLTHNNENYEFVSISTHANSDIEHSYDGDWGNNISWGINGPYDFTSDTQRSRKTWSQEFRFLSTPQSAFNEGMTEWLFGIYTLNLEEDNDILELYNGFTYRSLSSSYKARNSSIFAEITHHFSDVTELTASLRVENRDAEYSDTGESEFNPIDNMQGGNIALKHYFESGLMSWISASKGYKAGGFNISLSVPEERRQYEPESLWNYELGIKGRFLDNKLLLSASVFYMDRQDMQISTSTQLDPNDPLTFIFLMDNAAEGSNSGIEADLQYQLSTNWQLTTSLGLLNTEIKSYTGLDQTLRGREQAHAPAYNYSIGLEYKNHTGWFTRVDLTGKDAFYYSNSHQQQSTPYELLNAKIGFEAEQWAIFFWGKNLTDEIYHTRGFYFANEPPNWENKRYTQQGDPRQFGITARLMY